MWAAGCTNSLSPLVTDVVILLNELTKICILFCSDAEKFIVEPLDPLPVFAIFGVYLKRISLQEAF